MDTLAQCCAEAVAFSYRSIDRLVLNAYIPTLQTPAAVAVFFREVQRKPILAGKVFKELTDRFVSQVMRFAKKRDIPVLRPKGRTRPGEVAQKALKVAAGANRWGVVAIVVHQESARVFASDHAGGRATNYRVKEDRRLVNHYYFYFRDRAYGDGFVRISSYPPFQARVLRQGVVSCLKVFYKKSFLKQYNKGGRVLRTEVCINDPGDFGVRKSLVHLGYLGTIAHHALTRFSKAQAVALSTALDRSTFERIIMPSEKGGKRVAGIRFGAPGSMRVLEALGCAGLSLRAFSNTDLRAVLVERLGTPADQISPGHIGYQLRKLRGKGLVRKVKGRNLYTLTDLGYRVAIYFTKLHQRLLAPALNTFEVALTTTLDGPPHPLDRALQGLNARLDTLAQLCHVEIAA